MKTIVISLMKGLFLKCVDRRATRMGFVIEIRSDPRLNRRKACALHTRRRQEPSLWGDHARSPE